MRKLLLVSALATSLLSACGNDAEQPRFAFGQQPIAGGQYDQEHTNVMGIYHQAGWSGGMCTGTLIAPNLVLTARHCVAPSLSGTEQVICGESPFGSPFNASDLFFTTDLQISERGGNWYGAREVRTAPGGNDTCGYDVAIVVLQQNVPASVATPIVPRVDIPVEAGEIYSAVGYGNTNDYSGAGARRIRLGLSAACSQGSCGYGVEASEWRGETGICSGDSGGPALDQQGRVIGVVSRGAEGCTYPVYGSVRTWSEWIMNTAKDAAQMGGYEPPTWALTGSTEPDPEPQPDAGTTPEPDAGTGPEPQPGSQGQACSSSSGCPVGYQCYNPGDGNAFCAADCSQLGCGGQNTCAAVDHFSLCVPQTAQNNATSQSSGGCSVSHGERGPAKPVPWVIGVGLAAALLLRRRRLS